MEPIRFPGESAESRRARFLRERVDHLRDARQRIITAADTERRRINVICTTAHSSAWYPDAMLGSPSRGSRAIRRARQLIAKRARRRSSRQGASRAGARDSPDAAERAGARRGSRGAGQRAPLPVKIRGFPPSLPSAVESTAYYVTAEALTNVAKYARADTRSCICPVQDARLQLQVGDDGVGGADPSGTGLRGLRDRVDALDGALEVCSPPGGGTTVRIELPSMTLEG